MREEEDPQKPSYQKVGILLLLLLVVMMFYMFDNAGFFSEEEKIDCDPMLEDCDRLKIIVRLIGNYEQLITNT
jgi:hypothetical protein